jgi:protein-disulfide isomerase
MTKADGEMILKELREIRTLLEELAKSRGSIGQPTARGALPELTMPMRADWPSLGSADAPITLVEFADYECPYCRRFQSDTFPQLKKNYIDTGKVRFVSRDLPLDFHRNADAAAKAVRCAGSQGKYWEMRDILSAATELGEQSVVSAADQLSLDLGALRGCISGQDVADKIGKDRADAASLQISGTPTFVVGRLEGQVVKGVAITGAQPYENFERVIQTLLRGSFGVEGQVR